MLMAIGCNSVYLLPDHCHKTPLNISWVILLPCATLSSLQECQQDCKLFGARMSEGAAPSPKRLCLTSQREKKGLFWSYSNSDFAGTILDLRQQYGSHIKTEAIPSCVTETERQKPVTPALLNTSLLSACTTKLKRLLLQEEELISAHEEWVSSTVAGFCFPWHPAPVCLAAEGVIWSGIYSKSHPLPVSPSQLLYSDQASTKVPTWFLVSLLHTLSRSNNTEQAIIKNK